MGFLIHEPDLAFQDNINILDSVLCNQRTGDSSPGNQIFWTKKSCISAQMEAVNLYPPPLAYCSSGHQTSLAFLN